VVDAKGYRLVSFADMRDSSDGEKFLVKRYASLPESMKPSVA